MGVTRKNSVNLLLGAGDHHIQHILEVLLDLGGLVHEPDTHVRRDLVVPASARVQLAADIFANDLGQSAFVGRVDVFVVRLDLELLHVSDARALWHSTRLC